MRSDLDVAIEKFDKRSRTIEGVDFIAAETPGGRTKQVSLEVEEDQQPQEKAPKDKINRPIIQVQDAVDFDFTEFSGISET
jgi:hypothetical protein